MTGQTCFELCTESLGFESGNCSVGEGEEELDLLIPSAPTTNEEKVENVFQQNQDQAREDKIRVEGKRQKSFPPPLRWMSTHAGKQSSYMKSERKDGRLILTEVRIERPEVFQVSTGDEGEGTVEILPPMDRREGGRRG
ncbi:protein FANTASTIC FOUR 2-like isoform X2 [Carex rostrata]